MEKPFGKTLNNRESPKMPTRARIRMPTTIHVKTQAARRNRL